MNKHHLISALTLTIMTLLCLTTSGCGLIFGGVQKVDVKSQNYTVPRLDHSNPELWRLNLRPATKATSKEDETIEKADLNFENTKTGSNIIVNSVCNPYNDTSLEGLQRAALMGMTGSEQAQTNETSVGGQSALQSIFETPTPAGPAKVNYIVFKNKGCTFDFIYTSKTSVYEKDLTYFNQFIKEFKFNE